MLTLMPRDQSTSAGGSAPPRDLHAHALAAVNDLVSLPPAQECKALNGRLIDFLKRPENVAKLVMYVTEPASMTAEDKRQFKYPFASCEVGFPQDPGLHRVL